MQLTGVGKEGPQSPGADGRPSRPTNRGLGELQAVGAPASGSLTQSAEPVSQDGHGLPAVFERVQSRTPSMPGAADILTAGEAMEAAQWVVAQMREKPGPAILAQANVPAAAAWPLLETR